MDELEKIRQKKIQQIIKRQKMTEPIKVSDENFQEFIAKNDVVIVDFWAPWCGPCRMIGPILEEIAKDYAGKIQVGKMNVDENSKIPAENQIMSIPTIHIYKNNELVDKIVGALPKEKIVEKIDAQL